MKVPAQIMDPDLSVVGQRWLHEEPTWETLKNGNQHLSNNLAIANVIPLRVKPIKVILELFSPGPKTGEYRSVLELFNEFDWNVTV